MINVLTKNISIFFTCAIGLSACGQEKTAADTQTAVASEIIVSASKSLPTDCYAAPPDIALSYGSQEQAGYAWITDNPSTGNPTRRFPARVRRDELAFSTGCDVTVDPSFIFLDKACAPTLNTPLLQNNYKLKIRYLGPDEFYMYLIDTSGNAVTDDKGEAVAWDLRLTPQLIDDGKNAGFAWLTNDGDGRRWTFYVYLYQRPDTAGAALDKYFLIEYYDGSYCSLLKPPHNLDIVAGTPLQEDIPEKYKFRELRLSGPIATAGGSGQGGVGGGGEPPPHR